MVARIIIEADEALRYFERAQRKQNVPLLQEAAESLAKDCKIMRDKLEQIEKATKEEGLTFDSLRTRVLQILYAGE